MEDGRQFPANRPLHVAIAPDGKLILVIRDGERAEWFPPERVRDAVILDAALLSSMRTLGPVDMSQYIR
jgi:hypothetical protein